MNPRLYASPELSTDPLGTLEQLYADLGYPEEMSGLIRWMPAAPGEEGGAGATERHWAEYLTEGRNKHRLRNTST